MNARSVSKDGWTIKLVPKDETGQQLVLEEYKPSRLTALRLDPGCNVKSATVMEAWSWLTS